MRTLGIYVVEVFDGFRIAGIAIATFATIACYRLLSFVPVTPQMTEVPV